MIMKSRPNTYIQIQKQLKIKWELLLSQDLMPYTGGPQPPDYRGPVQVLACWKAHSSR